MTEINFQMKKVTLHDKTFQKYIDEITIKRAIDALALEINKDYQDKKPVFIGVLNGCFMFFSDLLKQIEVPCETTFMRMQSYSGTTSTGNVKEIAGLHHDINHRDVIVVEDIVDSGLTLDIIKKKLRLRNPASIATASLLFKPDAYQGSDQVDYIGLTIPNEFVVGFGLDYDELGRNLPAIYKIINQK